MKRGVLFIVMMGITHAAGLASCAKHRLDTTPTVPDSGESVLLCRIFDDSRPLRTWRGELIVGNVHRDIDLWREVEGRDESGVHKVHAFVKERERGGEERVVHEVEFDFDKDRNVFMTRVTEPRRNLDVHFDPPLLVAKGVMHAGEELDTTSSARVMDTREPAKVKYAGTARQRVQLRSTAEGLELRSELVIDLGLPTLRVRSRLVLDRTEPDRPYAAKEVTDALVRVGIAPVLREKRELVWLERKP